MIGDREIMIKEKIVSPFVKTLVNSNALDKIEDNMMPLKRKQAERIVVKLTLWLITDVLLWKLRQNLMY